MLPNLKLLRNGRDISQKKLAEELGLSQQAINRYENQSIEPDIDTLSRLAEYFDTSIDYLVGRTGIRGQTEKQEIFAISENEVGIVERYRTLNEKERKCIEMMLETLTEK